MNRYWVNGWNDWIWSIGGSVNLVSDGYRIVNIVWNIVVGEFSNPLIVFRTVIGLLTLSGIVVGGLTLFGTIVVMEIGMVGTGGRTSVPNSGRWQ
jgi:hypothetical protein